jgi:hypothetical protein
LGRPHHIFDFFEDIARRLTLTLVDLDRFDANLAYVAET